jgi:hypothetical protein
MAAATAGTASEAEERSVGASVAASVGLVVGASVAPPAAAVGAAVGASVAVGAGEGALEVKAGVGAAVDSEGQSPAAAHTLMLAQSMYPPPSDVLAHTHWSLPLAQICGIASVREAGILKGKDSERTWSVVKATVAVLVITLPAAAPMLPCAKRVSNRTRKNATAKETQTEASAALSVYKTLSL